MKRFVEADIIELDLSETADPGKGNHYGTDNNSGKHKGWGYPTCPPFGDMVIDTGVDTLS